MEFATVLPLGDQAKLHLWGIAGYKHFITGDETSAAAEFPEAPGYLVPLNVPAEDSSSGW